MAFPRWRRGKPKVIKGMMAFVKDEGAQWIVRPGGVFTVPLEALTGKSAMDRHGKPKGLHEMGGISQRTFPLSLGARRHHVQPLALHRVVCGCDAVPVTGTHSSGRCDCRAPRPTHIDSIDTSVPSSHTLQRAWSFRARPTTVFSSCRQGPRENAVTSLEMPACIDDGRAQRKERSRRLQPRRCSTGDLQFRFHRVVSLFTSSFEALASDWADWSRRTMRSLGPGAKGALLSWRQTDVSAGR